MSFKGELFDSRGRFVFPNAEQLAASGMTDAEHKAWDAVDDANNALADAKAQLAEAERTVRVAQAALDAATAKMNSLAPKVSLVESARAFMRASRPH